MIHINNIYFIKKRLYFVNPEKRITAYKPFIKR